MWWDTKLSQKQSVDLLYTNVKFAKKEIRETSPYKIVTNNIKYIGVTLTKQVKDVYDKKFMSLKE